MKTLTIRLAAPLQSYGNEATFNRRTSNYYPSKSAVVGMIAAALGYRRDDPKINELNDLKMAVRIDQPGKFLTDFQVVEYQKTPSKKAKKITYRSYLQDAVFVAAIGLEDAEKINQIKYALKHPKFQLFLGRRANAPAGLLEIDDFNDEPVKVLEELPWKASEWYQKKYRSSDYTAEIIADADILPNKRSYLVKDLVGSFNQKQRYHNYRAVGKEHVVLKNNHFKQGSNSEFDAMLFDN